MSMNQDHTRQTIQRLKDLPTLTPDIERILTACKDDSLDNHALAQVLMESPTITARLIGLANSAFFGQQGKVHALSYAISVLGLITVRSVAIGLSLSNTFKIRECQAFRADQYWLSAFLTGQLAQRLSSAIGKSLRPPTHNLFMAGFLHNIGLPALVHLYPKEMDRAFTSYHEQPHSLLGEHIRSELGVDHYQAGIWLGSKWHLPDDILLVMQHHYVTEYRGDKWPLVLLAALSATWAGQLIDGADAPSPEPASLDALEMSYVSVETVWHQLHNRMDAFQDMATTLSRA